MIGLRVISSKQASLRCFCLTVVCALTIGCQTASAPSSLMGFSLPWANTDDEKDVLAEADEKQGPLGRILQSGFQKKETGWTRSLPPQEGQAEFDRAKQLYEEEKHSEAEKIFKKTAKKYKRTTIEEEALFMVAEAQFNQQKFAKAETSYSKLVTEFPSTRYLDQTSKRLFTIAQHWLGTPTIVKSGEIEQVDFEDPHHSKVLVQEEKKPFDITRSVPILPNVTDRTRPAFDTEGRALEALKSIWLNDPTGPLADDALMLTASYHMRNADYLEADRYFEILRKDYPKSEHFEDAYYLGRPVKLMSYQGSDYDGKKLDEARQLNENMLRIFPRHEDRERILADVRKIDEAKAAQIWSEIIFYQKKDKPKAVAIYCNRLLDEYPQSPYAEKARQTLANLPAQYRKRFTIAGSGTLAQPPINQKPTQTVSYEETDEPETDDNRAMDDDYDHESEESSNTFERETFEGFDEF